MPRTGLPVPESCLADRMRCRFCLETWQSNRGFSDNAIVLLGRAGGVQKKIQIKQENVFFGCRSGYCYLIKSLMSRRGYSCRSSRFLFPPLRRGGQGRWTGHNEPLWARWRVQSGPAAPEPLSFPPLRRGGQGGWTGHNQQLWPKWRVRRVQPRRKRVPGPRCRRDHPP